MSAGLLASLEAQRRYLTGSPRGAIPTVMSFAHRIRPRPRRILSQLAALLALAAGPLCARAETLDDVLHSKVLDQVVKQTDRLEKKRSVKRGDISAINPLTNDMDPRAEYTKLWQTSRGPNLLFSWIGANLPKYRLVVLSTDRSPEDILARARIFDRSKQYVSMEIRVPHPNFYLMVESKTLSQFKQYEPPTLQVIAQEELEINGIPAMYYRTDKARCSLLLKLERFTIVNLSVERCQNSGILMDVAKSLDFQRLNTKLNS